MRSYSLCLGGISITEALLLVYRTRGIYLVRNVYDLSILSLFDFYLFIPAPPERQRQGIKQNTQLSHSLVEIQMLKVDHVLSRSTP